MAAAEMSAVAALIDGYHPGIDPDVLAITSSAADKGAKGWDRDFGAGRIDAPAALTASDVITGTPSASASASPSPTASRTPVKTRPVIAGSGTSFVAYGATTTFTFTVTNGGRIWSDRPAQVQRQDPKKGWVLVTAWRAEASHDWSGMVKGQLYRVVVPDTATLLGAISSTIAG